MKYFHGSPIQLCLQLWSGAPKKCDQTMNSCFGTSEKVSCLSGWVIGWEFLACHEFWVWRSSQQFWSAPPLFSSSRLGFGIDSLGKKTETQLGLVDWLVQRLYKKTTMDFSIWCLKKSSHVHGRHRAADLRPARKMIPRTWYCRCFGHYPNFRIGNY